MLKECTKCHEPKETDCFHKQRKAKDGLNYWCKECMLGYHRKYKRGKTTVDAETYQRILVSSRRANKRARQRSGLLLDKFKANGCLLCKEKEKCCLCAHHLDPSEKEFNIGTAGRVLAFERFVKELAKCVCLCHNCHTKVHAGKLQITEHIIENTVLSHSGCASG